jgi:hypothetical protein
MKKTGIKCGEVKPIGEMVKDRNQCKACRAEHNKQYYQDNKERIKQSQKQWRQDPDNKERYKQYQKQYRQDNKERQKQYRQDPVNKERQKQYKKQYYQDPVNKEHKKQYNKQYYQDNKERIKQYDKQYRQDPVIKERQKQYNKQYYQDNIERQKQVRKQYRQNLPAATYSITNTINGKVYIGQSTQYSRRWTTHKRNLRKNTHPNKRIQQDWNEYGEDAFVFEVIEELPPDTSSELLLEKEREQIIEHLKRDVVLYNVLN